jgi:hypothetical protein
MDLTSGSHVGFESTNTTSSVTTFAYESQGRHTLVCWNPLLSFHLIIVAMLSLVLKATVFDST